MGYGTSFKPDVYISKKVFNSIYDLEDQIATKKGYIEDTKQNILMYIAATPKDIFNEDIYSLESLQTHINSLFESLEETIYLVNVLEMFREHILDNDLNIKDFDPFKQENY